MGDIKVMMVHKYYIITYTKDFVIYDHGRTRIHCKTVTSQIHHREKKRDCKIPYRERALYCLGVVHVDMVY